MHAQKEYAKKYREEHREKIKLYHQKYYKQHKIPKRDPIFFWHRLKGVYEIICIINNTHYIGRTIDFGDRKSSHFAKLNKGENKNRNLQLDYNLYGKKNFIFNPIIICENDDAPKYEQYFIDLYKEKGLLYNIAPSATSSLGVKRTEKTKKKMSISGTNRKHSIETKRKLSKVGRKYSHLAQEWKNLYNQGISAYRIAKLYNMNLTTVNTYLFKHQEEYLSEVTS